jgi:hypothetical protein
MTTTGTVPRWLQVLWNLRALGLFLLGPGVGVFAVATIFGLPRALQLIAGAMFLLSLGMYATLVRSEWQRLAEASVGSGE